MSNHDAYAQTAQTDYDRSGQSLTGTVTGGNRADMEAQALREVETYFGHSDVRFKFGTAESRYEPINAYQGTVSERLRFTASYHAWEPPHPPAF